MSISLRRAVHDHSSGRRRRSTRTLGRLALLSIVSAMLVMLAASPAFALAKLGGSLMRADRVTSDLTDNLWPATSENRVAWVTGTDLYSQVQTAAPQLLASNVTTAPLISGDRVTWVATGGADFGTDYELFTWTPESGTVQLTQDIFNQQRLCVSGDRIVWMHPTVVQGPLQVWTWTPTEGIHMLTNGERNLNCAVSGDRVVWQGQGGSGQITSDSEIYTWTAADDSVVQLTENDHTDRSPFVSADMISWESTGGIPSSFEFDDGSDDEVWAWTPTDGLAQVTCNARDDVRSVVSDGRVAWLCKDTAENGGDHDVYTWTPLEGPRQLTADTVDQSDLFVSSSMLAWCASIIPGLDYKAIYLWDLAHPELGVQAPLGESWPAVSNMKMWGNRIVWSSTWPGADEGADLEICTLSPDATAAGRVAGVICAPGGITPVQDIRVDLCDAEWRVLQSVVTTASGYACFDSVTPGLYRLRWVDPLKRWATMYYPLASTPAESMDLIVWSGQETDINFALLDSYTADVTPPQTTTTATADWHHAPYDIRLEATDDSGDPITTYYKWYTTDPSTGTTRTLTSNPVMVNSDGVRYLEYWSIDAAGNEELPHQTLQVNIDSEAPITTCNGVVDYVNKATITFSAEDSAGVYPYTGTATPSGVTATYWRLDDGPWSSEPTITAYFGAHHVDYYSVDEALNQEAEKTFAFRVVLDMTKPSTVTSATAGWHNEPFYIYLAASDAWDSPENITTHYRWYNAISSGTTQTYDGAGVYVHSEGIRTFEYWSVDEAGNEDTPHKTLDVKLDSTAPTVTAAAINNRTPSVQVSITATDTLSGVGQISYRIDSEPTVTVATDSTLTPAQTRIGSHTIRVVARDAAGNERTFDSAFEVVTIATPPAGGGGGGGAGAADTEPPVTTVTLSEAGWTKNDVRISLNATDSGSGVQYTWFYWKFGTGAYPAEDAIYGSTFTCAREGDHTLYYWSSDNAGNIEAHHSVPVQIDRTGPLMMELAYNSLTASSISLSWRGWDAVSGVEYYRFDDGSTSTTTTATGKTLTGLQPGSTYTFTVRGYDKLDNAGASRSITIRMPSAWTSAMIPAGQLSTATISVPPGGGGTTLTANVSITGVTTPGELTIVRTPTPPTTDGGGLEVLGQYYDVSFTGAFTGALTITLPYDPRIPDDRARGLVLRHFTQAGVWETLETHVNTINHTITGVLHSLSPIAIAETTPTVTTVTVESRSSQPGGSFIAPYRGKGQVIVRVFDSANHGVARLTLVARDASSSVVATFAPQTSTSANSGLYAAKLPAVSNATTFTITLEPNDIHFVAEPISVIIKPRGRLLTPAPPATAARSGRAFAVSGRLLPAHAGTVKVVAYRVVGTKLVKTATTSVTAGAAGSFKARFSLKRGYYRFIAYHDDASHAHTTSPRSRILLVR